MKRPIRWRSNEARKRFINFGYAHVASTNEANEVVAPIIKEFYEAGSVDMGPEEERDQVLLRLTEKFDGVALTPDQIEISADEMSEALDSLESGILEAIELAAKRIRAFHEATLPHEIVTEPGPGERLVLRPSPLRRVGLYAPGGGAIYPSTVLMNATAAKVAGAGEIVLCTPPDKEGRVHPSVMAAARVAGVDRMFRIGGAQAIAAMAFGTASIPRVDKIAGPGNVYVAAAKRLVRDTVDIDKDAGPSEVVVVIDGPAHADWAAADMIAQAEHDEDAMAVGLAVGGAAAEALADAVERQLAHEDHDGRRGIIGRALDHRGAIFEVKNLDEALDAVETLAPEHLELFIEEAEAFAGKVRNAGAIFCGRWGTVPLGDYVVGTNHVLPTGRAARFASPLGVLDFIKWTSVVSFTEEGAGPLIEPAARLADLEGLPAHARALRLRRKDSA